MGPAKGNRNTLQQKRVRRTHCGLAVILLLAIALAPRSRAQQTDTNGAASEQEDSRGIRTRQFLGLGRIPDAKMAAAGAKIFGPTCGFCHGADARGASGPDLLRSPVI